MTAALEGGEWSAERPGHTLPQGETGYPFYRRMGGPQGRSGQTENLVPTGIRSRTVQPVAQSLYRLSYPAHTEKDIWILNREITGGWGQFVIYTLHQILDFYGCNTKDVICVECVLHTEGEATCISLWFSISKVLLQEGTPKRMFHLPRKSCLRKR